METKVIKARINGLTPILMHKPTCANPLHPLTKEIKAITSKRNKTDADFEQLAMLEIEANAYYDESVGFYLPAEMMDAAIRDGGKNQKKGKKMLAGIFTNPVMIPLEHDGPKTLEAIKKDTNYIDCRNVVVNRGSRMMRVRPRFNRWACEFEVHYYVGIVDAEDIISALKYAGLHGGMYDYRPRYGKFEVVYTKEV